PKFIFIPTLANYQKAITDIKFLFPLANSLIVAITSVGLTMILSIPAGYALSRGKFRRKNDLAFVILNSRMAPLIGVLIPFYLLFQKLHLLDTKLVLIWMYTAMNTSLAVWMMRGFFQDLPRELEESALIDGCSRFNAFLKIALPLCLPGIVATALLCFIFSWNEFLFALTLTSFHARTAPVAITCFIRYEQIEWGPLSASAIIVLIPGVIITLFLQRYLIRGLTFGALK
ncbi:unnamed protein product, partial [marine sediment metagenome]